MTLSVKMDRMHTIKITADDLGFGQQIPRVGEMIEENGTISRVLSVRHRFSASGEREIFVTAKIIEPKHTTTGTGSDSKKLLILAVRALEQLQSEGETRYRPIVRKAREVIGYDS